MMGIFIAFLVLGAELDITRTFKDSSRRGIRYQLHKFFVWSLLTASPVPVKRFNSIIQTTHFLTQELVRGTARQFIQRSKGGVKNYSSSLKVLLFK